MAHIPFSHCYINTYHRVCICSIATKTYVLTYDVAYTSHMDKQNLKIFCQKKPHIFKICLCTWAYIFFFIFAKLCAINFSMFSFHYSQQQQQHRKKKVSTLQWMEKFIINILCIIIQKILKAITKVINPLFSTIKCTKLKMDVSIPLHNMLSIIRVCACAYRKHRFV